MKIRLPGVPEFTVENSVIKQVIGLIAGMLVTLLAGQGVEGIKADAVSDVISSLVTGESAAATKSQDLVTAPPTQKQPSDSDKKTTDPTQDDADSDSENTKNTETGDAQSPVIYDGTPQSGAPQTPYFLAASLPKITGDEETIHPVVFSFMHNDSGKVSVVTGGDWSGSVNGRSVYDYQIPADPNGSTEGMLALKVKESDLHDIDVTFTKDGKKTTFRLDEPQLSKESQTTMFVPGQ